MCGACDGLWVCIWHCCTRDDKVANDHAAAGETIYLDGHIIAGWWGEGGWVGGSLGGGARLGAWVENVGV